MKIIIDRLYESKLKDISHGYRLDKNCHTALKYIYDNFNDSTWYSKDTFNISFDNIFYIKFINLIYKDIKDKEFINLLWKLLKNNKYYNKYNKNKLNIITFNILKPILINIYMNQFDNYVLDLKNKFENNALIHSDYNKNVNIINPDYNMINFFNKNLFYVRYEEEYLIAINGTYKESKLILKFIYSYLAYLGLIINNNKYNLINIYKEHILFLGINISKNINQLSNNNNINKNQINNNINYQFIFEAPINIIINNLKKEHFIENDKPAPIFKLISKTHDEILDYYNKIFYYYNSYYSFTHNYGNLLYKLSYILIGSCTKLLAVKFSLKTQSHVYKKLGFLLKSPSNQIFYIHKKNNYNILKFNKKINNYIYIKYFKNKS